MKKKFIFALALGVFLPLTLASCSSNNGPYIGENGNWFVNNEDTGIPAKGQNGQDGKDGTNGTDGVDGTNGSTPEIGENGNWWIAGQDTGIPATGAAGQDGIDGTSPNIGDNGNWWIGTVDTGIQAQGDPGKDGENGLTPFIGSNGNWWIGTQDTGIKAEAKAPEITIGDNGNWFIDGQDTGMPSKGEDGEDGDKIEIIGGYWYINGENTWVKAEGTDGSTPTITIGDNGNWFIDGFDTGKSAVNLDYYTVTLDLNGGSVDDDSYQAKYTVREGHTIPELPIPYKYGYEFLGWYTGLDQTSDRFTTTTQVYSDLSLTALYKSLDGTTYTIKWVNYDGTVLEVDEDVLFGAMPSYDGATPTKASDSSYSYVFDGWSPEVINVEKDTIYVAQYKDIPLKFTIQYELGGFGKLNNPVNEISYGQSLQLPDLDTSGVKNLAFAGWYLDSNYEERVSFPYLVTHNLTLRAKWVAINEEDFSYYSNGDGTYTIRSFLGEDLYYDTIAIPGTHNGYPVTGIDNAFQNNQNINNVVLPDSIVNINKNAFKNSSLKSINFNSALETIGDSAFENCDYLSIDAEPLQNIKTIGNYAFQNCYEIKLLMTQLTNLTSIGNNSFNNTSLASFDFESATNLNKIGTYAFYQTKFNKIDLSQNHYLRTIESGAFSQNGYLQELILPSNLTRINSSAFSYCTSLKSLILSSSITYIEGHAFDCCTSLSLYVTSSSKPYNWDENFAGDTLVYYYSSYEPSGAGMYWHYDTDGVTPVKW